MPMDAPPDAPPGAADAPPDAADATLDDLAALGLVGDGPGAPQEEPKMFWDTFEAKKPRPRSERVLELGPFEGPRERPVGRPPKRARGPAAPSAAADARGAGGAPPAAHGGAARGPTRRRVAPGASAAGGDRGGPAPGQKPADPGGLQGKTQPVKFYAVLNGRNGSKIYTSWEEVRKNAQGRKGTKYQSFALREDAEEFINNLFVLSS